MKSPIADLLQWFIETSHYANITIAPEKLGEYTLFAQTSDAVLTDSFAQGQRVDSGIELMLIADESALWVAAQQLIKTCYQ